MQLIAANRAVIKYNSTVSVADDRSDLLIRINHRLMLTRLIGRSEVVSEATAEYNAGVENEYRDAEYEYKYDQDEPVRCVGPTTPSGIVSS